MWFGITLIRSPTLGRTSQARDVDLPMFLTQLGDLGGRVLDDQAVPTVTRRDASVAGERLRSPSITTCPFTASLMTVQTTRAAQSSTVQYPPRTVFISLKT